MFSRTVFILVLPKYFICFIFLILWYLPIPLSEESLANSCGVFMNTNKYCKKFFISLSAVAQISAFMIQRWHQLHFNSCCYFFCTHWMQPAGWVGAVPLRMYTLQRSPGINLFSMIEARERRKKRKSSNSLACDFKKVSKSKNPI